MVQLTAEESKHKHIKEMGTALGTQFSEIWQQVAYLHFNWQEFIELFGTKPTRVELLNQVAPAFFHMVQKLLWEETLLHIARLTDAPRTAGRENLTIRNLPELVSDP